MTPRSFTTILATTLAAVTTPQLARAMQPEGDTDASGGVSAGASLGAGTETDASARKSGSDRGSTSAGGDPPDTTSAASDGSNDSDVPRRYDGDADNPRSAPPGEVKGKLRVHFNVDFLVQPTFPNTIEENSAAAAVRPLYGLGFGYGIHKNFVIGAKFGINFVRVRNRNNDLLVMGTLAVDRHSDGFFTPYFEYLPIATGRILPFLGARMGFGWQTDATRLKDETAAGVIETGSRTTQLGPLVGLNAGAHFFLTRSFSLDAGMLFDTRWNFGRTRVLGEGAPPPPEWAPSNAVMNFGLTLGLSGWF